MTARDSYIKLSELEVGNLSIKKDDIENGLYEFENKLSKRFAMEGEVLYNGKPFLVVLKAYVASDGVVERDWSIGGKEGKYYTLKVSLPYEEDLLKFEEIERFIEHDLNNDEWSTYNPIKDEQIALKMKVVGGRYTCRFNDLKVKLGDDDFELKAGDDLEIVGHFSVDYHFEGQQAKILFTATRIKY
jgi:hypothetical protein